MPKREIIDKIAEKYATEIEGLVKKIAPMLGGRNPAVQSAVLADLLAIWLIGFPKQEREHHLQDICTLIRNLIPVNETEYFGEAGHPFSAETH